MDRRVTVFIQRLLRLLPAGPQRRLSFAWRYRRGETPWDTNETPPEVKAFIQSNPPTGRALDLGCGTGTNTLFLAEHGWQATGIDYVEQAIQQARTKAAQKRLHVTFLQGDVTQLDTLPLDGPFNYLLDLGCLHSIPAAGWLPYGQHVTRLAAPDALYMLYAFLPRQSSVGAIGMTPQQITALFTPAFILEHHEPNPVNESSWYWFRRTAS